MNLADRIGKLEQAAPADDPVMIVRFVMPEDPGAEMRTLRGEGQVWTRHDGETEEAFMTRAEVEVPKSSTGRTILYGESK